MGEGLEVALSGVGLPTLDDVKVNVVSDDGTSQLPGSYQVSSDASLELQWSASNADKVVVSSDRGEWHQLAPAGMLPIDTRDGAEWSLVAIGTDGSTSPVATVEIYTHPAGTIMSSHATVSPPPSAVGASFRDPAYAGTEPLILQVTGDAVTLLGKDGTSHAVPRFAFETGYWPGARPETEQANNLYAEAWKRIALISVPIPAAHHVSVELGDAPYPGAPPELRVREWLMVHKEEIVAAEQEWRVDRRAIAGAIAWEALYNFQPAYLIGRFSGPGKVHFKDHYLKEGLPLSKEVEDRGLLPPQSEDDRQALLATLAGACKYIGAAMRAFIDVAGAAGYDLSANLPTLLFLYNAWHLSRADEDFKTKKAPAPLDYTGSKMAVWFADLANAAYIEAAVGTPPSSLSQGGSP